MTRLNRLVIAAAAGLAIVLFAGCNDAAPAPGNGSGDGAGSNGTTTENGSGDGAQGTTDTGSGDSGSPLPDPIAEAPFTLLNLNDATEEQLNTIPGMTRQMLHEFDEYRPYVSIQQFRREISKYVGADVVAGYEKFIYVPIAVDECDAETLMQLPGVDQTVAEALIGARPFGSNDAFLTALAEQVSEADAAKAKHYLAMP